MVNVPQSGVPLSGGGPASRDWYQFFTQLVRDVDGKFPGSPTAAEVAGIIATILTARGQIIRRGASAPEALAAQTANTFLGGDGTDVTTRTVAQVLTSLGISFGSWTPTCTTNTNVDSVSANGAGWYAIIGTAATSGIGIGACDFTVNATVAATLCNWRFTLPATPTTFSSEQNATGAGVATTGAAMRIRALNSNTIMLVQGITNSTADVSFTCVFVWRL